MAGIYRISGVIYDDYKKQQLGFKVKDSEGAEYNISFKQAIKLYDQNRLLDCILKVGRIPYFCGRNGLKLSDLPLYKFKDGEIVQAKALRLGVEVVEAENYLDITERIIYELKSTLEPLGIHLGRIRDLADSHGKFKVYTAAFRLESGTIGQLVSAIIVDPQTHTKFLQLTIQNIQSYGSLKYTGVWSIGSSAEEFAAIEEQVDTSNIIKQTASTLTELSNITNTSSSSEALLSIIQLISYNHHHMGYTFNPLAIIGGTALTDNKLELSFSYSNAKGIKESLISGQITVNIPDSAIQIVLSDKSGITGVPLQVAKDFLKSILKHKSSMRAQSVYTVLLHNLKDTLRFGINEDGVLFSLLPEQSQSGDQPFNESLDTSKQVKLLATYNEFTHKVVCSLVPTRFTITVKVYGPSDTPEANRIKTTVIDVSHSANPIEQRSKVVAVINSDYV